MGRPRSKHFDLPPGVQRKGAMYYYVTSDKGCRLWVSIGHDKEEAISRAAAYRAGAPVERASRDSNLRDAVMRRDGFRCVYCGATTQLCVDHVIPVASGGANVARNVVVACVPCNSKKRSMHPRYFVDALQKVAFK